MNRYLVFSLVAALSGLAACSSTPVDTASTDGAAATTATTPAASSPSGTPGSVPQSTVATVTLPPHLDPTSPISRERSVYFEYDDFSIKSQYVGLIERQAKYLVSAPTLSVKLEGNADERGSSEYNLALGQKRAEAVLKALRLYGVKESQLEAVSWGKERPKATGHDEAAWAENRRVDIVYPRQ
jgi:peptidoglycan-associated lipoprotein